MFAVHVNVVLVQHLHDPRRSAGQETRVADHDLAHIVGVEGVHVLAGVDGQQDLLLIVAVALRQGQLAQDAVDVLPPIQLCDEGQQSGLAVVGGQDKFFAVDAALLAVLLLVPYVHLRGGVLPH